MLLSQSNEVNKKKRAFSAKAPSTRSRPLSGLTNKVNQKTQLLQGIYAGGSSPFKKQKSKNLFQGIKTQQLQKYKKHPSLKTTKNREQLFEQNMGLKKQINKLQQELSILKGRFQATKRRGNSKSKQMQIEFEKQLYWGGSKSHLISGIKFQYEKLKRDYNKKCNDFEELKIALLESRVPQYKIYAQNVEIQNKRLTEKLEKMLVYNSSQMQVSKDHNSKQVSQYMLMQSEDKRKQIQLKIQQVDLKLKAANQNLSDKDKKIMFLQKLIIEKDNNQFHTIQKARKMQKIKEQICQQNLKLKETVEKLLYSTQKRVQDIKDQKEKEMLLQKQVLKTKIEEKDRIINQLNEDNKYLEAAINKLRVSASIQQFAQSKLQSNSSKQVKSNELGKMIGSIQIKDFQMSQSKQQYQEITKQKKPEVKKRVQQTADKRHSEEGKKVRKIQHTQIQQTTQFLKYRLIAQNINFNQIKGLFNYEQDQYNENREWDKQYISMRQVVDRLCRKPFCLDIQQSQFLGRYIIEDVNDEYVYFDYGNQHKRQVVKSIIRALIGEYDLGDRQQAQNQFVLVINKYSSNIESALEKLYPGGKISNRRLIQIMGTLGVQASETFYTLLIAKLAAESQSLNELQFRKVFN